MATWAKVGVELLNGAAVAWWWAGSKNGVELFRPVSHSAKVSVCFHICLHCWFREAAAAKTEGSVKTCAGAKQTSKTMARCHKNKKQSFGMELCVLDILKLRYCASLMHVKFGIEAVVLCELDVLEPDWIDRRGCFQHTSDSHLQEKSRTLCYSLSSRHFVCMEIPCVSKQISRRSQIDRMMLQVQGYETMPSPPTDLVLASEHNTSSHCLKY